MKKNAKEKLSKFLDENVFNPVLEVSADEYSGEEQEDLKSLKEAMAHEKNRYHNFEDAEEIKNQFHADIMSETSEDINEKLDRLNLPKLSDVEGEFDDLYEEMEK